LGEHGYNVFGTSRNPGSAEVHPNVVMLKLDVRSDAEVKACMDAAGAIDVLVNNAGYELAGAIEETSLDELKAQFETNFFGVARMVKAALPGMRQRRRGRIINVSSLAGLTSIPFMGIYSASKFALEGYTETLRQELLPFNIHVSMVEAGFLKTPMMEHRQVARAQISEYDRWRGRAFAAISAKEQKAPGPELVAETIRRIVESRKPRLRYMTGRQANLLSRLHRWLPEPAFEKGVRRAFRLDDRE
jgi:NAD(P)-dependent dehydrogenase (short-subunit alcohol dehydrogenase family)